MTIVSHSTVSDSGRVVIKESTNLSLKGVGQTNGANYVANQSNQRTISFDGNDTNPFTSTNAAHLNIIGQGSAPNFRLHILFHLTYNANGELTALQFQSSSDCN